MANQIELPVDADGEPIRIGDVLYSRGNECRVVSITVRADETCVGVHTDEGVFLPSVNPKYLSRKNPVPLERPDSWEKLLDDMDKAIHAPDHDTYASLTCGYFDSVDSNCTECERKNRICRETCFDSAWVDVTVRIHKLMVGEGK